MVTGIKPIVYKEPEVNEETITEGTILEALKGLGVQDPAQVLRKSKNVVDKSKVISENYVLSNEEAVVVTSYTYEDKTNRELSPYRIINEKLRKDKAQDQTENKKSYLCLLLKALRKLPRTKPQILYRGIKEDEKKEYTVGEEIPWQNFTSTSTSLMVTQKFLKSKGKAEGTLFEIRNAWGYDIADFSLFSKEEGS